MRQLEERLGMRLLNRTTRSVSVTDAGLRLLERLRSAIDQIAGALKDLNQERQRRIGRLRIYANHVAAAAVIAPIWGCFLSAYPDVPSSACYGYQGRCNCESLEMVPVFRICLRPWSAKVPVNSLSQSSARILHGLI
jgi:regulatory helix-turn-helix LysR family protein